MSYLLFPCELFAFYSLYVFVLIIFLFNFYYDCGCNFNRFARLNESVVYINAVRQGDAVGYISSEVSNSGDQALLMLSTLARNGQEVEQFYTNNTVTWDSPSVWTSAGNIVVDSVLRLVDMLNWDANGLFTYGGGLYSVEATDLYKSGSQLFYVQGTGGYGGNWNNW